MSIARTLVLTALLMGPGLAAADTYQLWLEVFDESRETTICKYRSGMGKDGITEYSGRWLCPRVACEIPPEKDRSATARCLPVDVVSTHPDQRAGPPPVRL